MGKIYQRSINNNSSRVKLSVDFMEKKTKLLILIFLVVGFFLRIWNLREIMGFDYDQEVAAFAVDKILSGKLTLIGQEISIGGVFIGPAYYYLLSFIYWLFNGDPIGVGYMVAVFSVFTMLLIFFVAKEIFGLKTALISLIFYATNAQINFYDRTTAPSNLIMLTSLVVVYLLLQVKKGKTGITPIIFLIISLATFHLHPSLIVLFPFVLVIFNLWQLAKPTLKQLLLIIIFSLITISPLILFDIRHQFINFQGLTSSISTPGNQAYAFIFKLLVIMRIQYENFASLFSLNGFNIVLSALSIFFFYKFVSLQQRKLIAIWLFIPLLVFSFYSRHIPEYYLLSSLPALILIISVVITKFSQKFNPIIVYSILSLVISTNIFKIFNSQNPFSLLYKQQTVEYLVSQGKEDVFVSFDADYGLQSGLNYLLKKQGIKLADSNNFPTHTIVIPHERRRSEENEIIFGGLKVIKSPNEFKR